MDFRHWQTARYDSVVCSVICVLGMLDNARSGSTVHPACTLQQLQHSIYPWCLRS